MGRKLVKLSEHTGACWMSLLLEVSNHQGAEKGSKKESPCGNSRGLLVLWMNIPQSPVLLKIISANWNDQKLAALKRGNRLEKAAANKETESDLQAELRKAFFQKEGCSHLHIPRTPKHKIVIWKCIIFSPKDYRGIFQEVFWCT